MEFIGIVKEVSEKETVNARSGQQYEKQQFLLEQEGVQYPESIGLTLFGDKVAKFPVAVGQRVKAKFNSRCNSHNGKFFNEHTVWSVEYVNQ